jgi:hypothetical protein
MATKYEIDHQNDPNDADIELRFRRRARWPRRARIYEKFSYDPNIIKLAATKDELRRMDDLAQRWYIHGIDGAVLHSNGAFSTPSTYDIRVSQGGRAVSLLIRPAGLMGCSGDPGRYKHLETMTRKEIDEVTGDGVTLLKCSGSHKYSEIEYALYLGRQEFRWYMPYCPGCGLINGTVGY